jgi:hypothetical protein
VTSVCPFYTAKEVVFEPALVGDWSKGEEVWKFDKVDDSYRFVLIEGAKATVAEAHAFKLGDQLFLDLGSVEQDYRVIPPHYLLKVTQLKPTLRMCALNHDWLKEFVKKNPKAIAHHLLRGGDNEQDQRVVLTADTPALQKLVLDNLKNKDAWGEELELQRQVRAAQ